MNLCIVFHIKEFKMLFHSTCDMVTNETTSIKDQRLYLSETRYIFSFPKVFHFDVQCSWHYYSDNTYLLPRCIQRKRENNKML